MRILFFVTAMLVVSGIFAQFKIRGTVSSADGSTLPGASVVIQNTTIGTVADNLGNYKLSGIDPGTYTIQASFIGYDDYISELTVKEDISLNILLEQDDVLTEEVFVYATRAGKKTPMASSTILKDEIEDKNLGQDIPFLLNSTPSFVTSSDAGAGIGYTNFRIRGTDANRINITINGIPVNDSESHGVWWVNMPDFSSSLENIQVQRGVGTSSHGAAGFGASINMQTNTLQKEGYAEYSGTGGLFNTIKNTVRIGSGLIRDHFSFDARLSSINSDGFIDRASTNLKSYFVSGGYYTEKSIIKLNVFSGKEKTYQAWNGVPSVRLNNDLEGMQRYGDHWLISSEQTEEMIAANSRTYNLYTYENETDNYQQDHYQLLFSHQFSDALNFNAATHYTYGRGYYEQYKEGKKFSDYGLENVIAGGDTITRRDLVQQKWLDNKFYGGTFSFNYNKNKTDVTFGGSWNKYDGDHFGNVVWTQYANNNSKDHEWYRSNGLKTEFNTFGKYNYSATDDFNLFADVQYRNIQYSIEGIDDDLRDLTQNHTFSFVNPKLGVFFQPNKNTKAYLSWSVGHREPSRSNFVDADPNGDQPTFETLNDFESGYTYQSKRYSIGANLYYMLYKDQLILTGEINDVGSAIMTNVDDSYRAGIEIMAGVKIIEDLAWNINATLSQNKITNFTEYVDNWDTWGQEAYELGTTDIAFSPNIIVNSTINYSPINNLILSLISNYVGDQFIDNSSSDERKLDAYFVNNLKISYSMHPNFFKAVEIHLLVNNLLNEEYESNAWVYSYLLGKERFKMDGYFPQAGTNFLLGLNIRF